MRGALQSIMLSYIPISIVTLLDNAVGTGESELALASLTSRVLTSEPPCLHSCLR